jgi:hypothetical protein
MPHRSKMARDFCFGKATRTVIGTTTHGGAREAWTSGSRRIKSPMR